MPDISAATVAATFTSTWVSGFGRPHRLTGISTHTDHFLPSGVKRHGGKIPSPSQSRPQGTPHPHLLDGSSSCHPARPPFSLQAGLGVHLAELVFGTTLRLPGEFLASPKAALPPDPANYVSWLKDQLRPAPPRQPSLSRLYVHDDLETCTHVFVRVDAVRKPLQPPYTGPYQVVSHTSKFFFLIINGKQKQVSIDRLKPAYIEAAAADLTAALISTPHSVYQPAAPRST
ncbi:uncharacterized protein LOC135390170 [Ornithodoros turicata]|uniref:uncharacterized protein LOC135390170 n=1 Tax=Ornithodoros turicata TaxID=34597 RepID=UPI00313900EC